MWRKVLVLSLCLALVGPLALFAGGEREAREAETLSLRIATNHTRETPASVGLRHFAERVSELTDGQVQIDIFYDAVLGTESEAVEQVFGGALAMTRVSTGHLNQFVPILDVFSVPYLFRDLDHKWSVLDGPIGAELEEHVAAEGLKLLYWVESGARSIYNNVRPINHPRDVQGLTIRVMGSPLMIQTIEELGASPTTTSFAEVYNALQTGVIEGAENSPSSVQTMRHDEVTEYYSLNEHMMIPDVLVMSLDVWNRLNPQQQAAIEQAAEDAKTFTIDEWVRQEEEALDEISGNMSINFIDDKQPFIDALRPLHARANQRFDGLVERIQQWED